MGFFPSNFVIVLDESFRPASRSVSPFPVTNQFKDRETERQKEKEKAKSRRPFQGYKKAPTPGSGTPASSTPVSSPVKAASYNPANPPSTVLWQQPPQPVRMPSRSPSPMPDFDIGSSPPPPPPPPHRVAVNEHLRRSPSPQPPMDHYNLIARTPSPGMASVNGHTPPMLRDAMDDVMSSLEDMSMTRQHEEPNESSFNPWSPEAFDEIARPPQRPDPRPMSSLGLGAGGSNYSQTMQNYSSRHNSPDRYQDGPPQLETYVQRMESRLRRMNGSPERGHGANAGSDPPEPPPKNSPFARLEHTIPARGPSIRTRKSAYELGSAREPMNRTFTTKTNSTNSSSGVRSNATNMTSMTGHSIMSGHSAGAFSATSAGSLAKRGMTNGSQADTYARPMTSSGIRQEYNLPTLRPQTPLTGFSYHSSHDSASRGGTQSAVGWETQSRPASSAGLGGFTTPKAKKQGFFKKLMDSAKTGAASSRSAIATGPAAPGSGSPKKTGFGGGINAITGGLSPSRNGVRSQASTTTYGRDAAKEMGLLPGLANDWVSMRRDVNRSNTPGPSERQERANRCQILDQPVIYPIEELFETVEGSEGADGNSVREPFQISNPGFSLVDKSARFITSLPATITASILATGYICRPHRSDVQRLRAIFIWCAERVVWDEDLDGEIDTRRVIQNRRGSSRELAVLVMEMCLAVGIHCEVVPGYIKSPGEDINLDILNRGGNHHWNALVVDGEWRMMDASLASPSNPRRSLYSNVSTSIAEAWYFLTRPTEFCYTHVPLDHIQQKLVPPISPDVLLALPVALPPYFRLHANVHNYDTSAIRLEGLELAHISLNVNPDIEIVAEVETKSYLRDHDGDFYENNDADATTRKRVLAQPSWYTPAKDPTILQKRYIVKALLPGDEGQGILKIYAGKKGMMHSSKDIIHPLALALPIYHSGENPAYDFLTRHPTPHAMRQDLYVIQPQCRRLVVGETYVFCVRQHAASVVATPVVEKDGFDFSVTDNSSGGVMFSAAGGAGGAGTGGMIVRPTSAMSMTSSSAGSNPSTSNSGSNSSYSDQASTKVLKVNNVKDKPAKLAIQTPAGKIVRLARKSDGAGGNGLGGERANADVDGEVQGSLWETVVKCQERGVWRGLVLADRSARWCVWGEWDCA